MSADLEKTIYALIGGFAGFILTSIVKWYTDKKERKRVKTAEYFSTLSKYVDYILTVTFYPKSYVENNYGQILLHLEGLKSQLIESQCLLVAYNYEKYLKTKDVVSEIIKIDGDCTEIIFTKNYTDAQLKPLNRKAFDLIQKIQTLIEDSGVD